MYNWKSISNTRDRDWTGFRRSLVIFFSEIWGCSRIQSKQIEASKSRVLSCIHQLIFLSFFLPGRTTDWLNKKRPTKAEIRQCTVGCCLLNFRCCCSILFVKISLFSYSFVKCHVSNTYFFFSISYNTSNQHLNFET